MHLINGVHIDYPRALKALRNYKPQPLKFSDLSVPSYAFSLAKYTLLPSYSVPLVSGIVGTGMALAYMSTKDIFAVAAVSLILLPSIAGIKYCNKTAVMGFALHLLDNAKYRPEDGDLLNSLLTIKRPNWVSPVASPSPQG